VPAAVEAAPAPPTELEVIAALEDRRVLSDGRLAELARRAPDPQVRARAVLALGRLQEPSTLQPLAAALTDPEGQVRREAAFSCGLLGLSWVPLSPAVKKALAEALLAAEASEQSAEVKLALLDALGKVVTPETTQRLVERLALEGAVQGRAALALGVSAKNGALVPPKALATLARLLGSDHLGDTRYAAAYALVQTKAPATRAALLTCAVDEVGEVRAVCAKGLGEVGLEADAVLLQKALDDPDRRVGVEAARALSKLALKCRAPGCASLKALAELKVPAGRFGRGDLASAHLLLAFAQSPLPPSAGALVSELRGALKGVTDQRLLGDAANLDCRLAAALDRLSGTLKEVLTCGGGLVGEPRRLSLGLEAVAAFPGGDPVKRAAALLPYADHADPRVRIAALGALGELRSPASLEKVRAQLTSGDLVIAGAAAGAAAKLKDAAAIPAIRELARRGAAQVDLALSVAEALKDLNATDAAPELEVWLGSPNASVRAAAAAALTALRKTPVPAPRVEAPEGAPKPTPGIPADAKLRVLTEKGELEVELFTRDAPLTSANLYTLAQRGYFKDLTFHRVVPDFVVQGGDPRGDGEGGPGYAIRCEINAHPYVRGTMGMALSGKDTGGSQFFFTIAPQPHLDGRYTTFGQVTKGVEVIDALLEGDRIIDVVALP
jgi:cyclophilin family peptidyl-prolyl cis-trans isomerase/HEAT repeat protein